MTFNWDRTAIMHRDDAHHSREARQRNPDVNMTSWAVSKSEHLDSGPHHSVLETVQ